MAKVLKSNTTLQRQAAVAAIATAATAAAAIGSVLFVLKRPPQVSTASFESALLSLWPYLLPVAAIAIASQVGNLSLISIRGYLGELAVSRALRRLPDEYLILNDVLVAPNGQAAQIDHVILSPYGLWCVETKSHRGRVYGRERERMWTQVKRSDSGKTYRKPFYSPVRQNAVHCERLAQHLREGLGIAPPIHSMVVFTSAELDVEVQTPVVRPGDVTRVVGCEARQRCVSEADLERIVSSLVTVPPAGATVVGERA